MSLKLEYLKDKILSDFDTGKSASEIANELGEYPQAVANVIKKYRNLSSLSPQGSANFRYFQTIDSHLKAYFLGFIAGDGALVKSTKSNCITLTVTLHEKDIEVLETLRRELEMSRPLYHISHRNQVRLVLSNKDLASDLMSFGIMPRKSLTMPNLIPNVPNQYRNSFILGYFDADGSCTVRTVSQVLRGKTYYNVKQAVQIRGTEDMLLGIVRQLEINSYHIAKCDGIPNLAISSKKEFVRFYNQIYRDCPFYLKRKHDKFLPIVNQDQTISSSAANDNVRKTELGARVRIIA